MELQWSILLGFSSLIAAYLVTYLYDLLRLSSIWVMKAEADLNDSKYWPREDKLLSQLHPLLLEPRAESLLTLLDVFILEQVLTELRYESEEHRDGQYD